MNLTQQIYYRALIIISYSLFVCSLFHAGTTWDGLDGLNMIKLHLLSGVKGFAFDSFNSDHVYYGITNILPGFLLYKITSYFLCSCFSTDVIYYVCSHIATFLMGTATSYIVVKTLQLLEIENSICWLSGTLLLIYPIWLGYSFFDYKDIPTAFIYTFFTYCSCNYLKNISLDSSSKKDFFTLLVSASLMSGVKLALLVPISLSVLMFFLYYWKKNNFLTSFNIHFLLFLSILLTTYFVTPAAWREPIRYTHESLLLMSKHSWNGCTLTWGKCISTHANNWKVFIYLLKWTLSQIPIGFLFLCAIGFFYISSNKNLRLLIIPILLQLFLLPILIIIKNSVVYDGIRHILFTIPACIIFSAFGIQFLKNNLQGFSQKIFDLALFIYLLFMGMDNICLQPYQYVYFNEIARFKLSNENMETDYWGFSLRETLKFLPNDLSNKKILVFPKHLIELHINMRNTTLLDGNEKTSLPFYFLCITRTNFKINNLHCNIIGEISRQLLLSPKKLILARAYECR